MQLLIRSNDSPCNFRRWMRQWPYDRAEHASCNAFMAITKIMRQRRGAATETCLFSRKSTPGYSSRLCRVGQTARPGTNSSLDHDRTALNFLYICHCIITDKFTSSRLHSESESIGPKPQGFAVSDSFFSNVVVLLLWVPRRLWCCSVVVLLDRRQP